MLLQGEGVAVDEKRAFGHFHVRLLLLENNIHCFTYDGIIKGSCKRRSAACIV